MVVLWSSSTRLAMAPPTANRELYSAKPSTNQPTTWAAMPSVQPAGRCCRWRSRSQTDDDEGEELGQADHADARHLSGQQLSRRRLGQQDSTARETFSSTTPLATQ